MAAVQSGSTQSSAKKPTKQRKLFTLWVHDVHFSAVDLVINPDYFPPETKVGDIVEIYKQGNREKALYLAIGAVTTIKANLHLSVKDTIASACELANREEIVANVVSKESVAVDFAEVTFKDQFISRSDMWRLKMHLKETCAYVGKSISYSCIRASIRELLSSEHPVHSGYITANTKIVFRSRSAEYIMLFQMSREMWDFAPDGQLYFEKAVNKFLPALFAKWRALGADHCLSMVMFSRTYYDQKDLFHTSASDDEVSASTQISDDEKNFANSKFDATNHFGAASHSFSSSSEKQPFHATGKHYDATETRQCKMDPVQQANLLRDHAGRYYHDFYTVVCIEERTNWERVVMQLKTKFEEYPYMVNWRVHDANPDKYHSDVLGDNATAEYSGFLEAINLAQNMLDSRHFTDRDLTRTGQSVVVISAGTGIFIVDPSLEHQTKQRMIDKGIGCDLVCVTKPPLHVVPLFIMKLPYASTAYNTYDLSPNSARSQANSLASGTPSRSLTPASPYSGNTSSLLTSQTSPKNVKQSFPSHKIAHWVYLFFHDLHVQHDPASISRNFTTTCTMPDFLQRNHDCTGIILPLKMTPCSFLHPTLSPNLLTSPRSDSSLNSGILGIGGIPTPNQGTSNQNSKSDAADSDRLGMVHHMDMDVGSPESSHSDKLTQLMDSYDASIFSSVPKCASNAKISRSSSSSGSGSTHTPTGQNSTTRLGTPHHSTTSLHSPSLSHHSPGGPALERASTLTVPLGGASGKRGERSSSILGHSSSSVGALGRHSTSISTSSSSLQNSGRARHTTSGASTIGISGPGSALGGASSASHAAPLTMPTKSTTMSVEASGDAGERQTQNPSGSLHTSVNVMQSVTPSSSVSSSMAGQEAMSQLKTPMKFSSNSISSSPMTTNGATTPETGVFEVNPFTLELKPAPPASNRRRWEHLWVRHSIQFDFLESDPSGPHWKSLTQPASLPLTTSYFPGQKELKDHFHFYSHSVDPDDSIHEMPLEEHLTEHIAQRLVQGAQIMLPDGATLNPNNAFLSAGNSFHNLTIKKPNIIVNWYVAKNKILNHEPIRYKYFLWTEHTSRRLSKEVDLHYKSIIHYPWNTLDQLLSGYQLEFMDNYNYWHINLMLVPSDSKMSTTAAIAGFNKFKEILTQRMVKLQDPDFGPMKVDIHVSPTPPSETDASLSTAFAAASASATGTSTASFKAGRSSASSPAPIPEVIESHNTQLIVALLKESNLVNERYLSKGEREPRGDASKTYIFIASKVVDWMMAHVTVRNRTEAVDICSGLVSSGVFKPVSLPLGSPFRDGANYFAIVDPSTTSFKAPQVSPAHSTQPLPPGSAPVDRRHAANPGPLPATSQSHKMTTTTMANAVHSAAGAPGLELAASELVASSATISEAGILAVPEDFSTHGHHHNTLKASASSASISSAANQPSSQPTEPSPLDLAPGGGNLGSATAIPPMTHANSAGSIAVGHTYVDPSFTKMEKPMEDPTPSMPHHTHAPSGTIRVAMDPSKTDRYEWINVVYDTIFDPSVAYEFQFQWLCSTGCVLSEFITQLTRKAKGLGFSLIQIPVKHDVVHSFLSPRKDSFSWAELSSAHQLAVCHVLVKVLDFLPRKRPNQFIHRSGVIIIDISNNIFEWTVNWTDVNAYTTAQNFELLKRFRDFMHQVTLLKQQSSNPDQHELTYADFLAGLLQKVAPFSAQALMTSTTAEPSES